MIHENILRYRGGRYARWALALCVCSALLYVTQGGREKPGGGTWQGYVLGSIGALLILYALLRSMVITLAQGGIRWRGTFYSLAELRKHSDSLKAL